MASGSVATSFSTVENVEHLTKADDIKKAYERLCKEEVVAQDELSRLLDQQQSLHSKMASLQAMLPNLQLVHSDSQQLANMVTFTSTLAENVSSKVRQLDIAKGRVVWVQQRVEDILDLKFCTDGVQTALQEEDYEQAAAHVHRFLSLDENVLRMSADASEGSTLDTSFKLLHESQTKLKNIVHTKFDAAVHSGDVASVERFFKIYPLIGEHDNGLSKFSKYLCSQLADTAGKNLKLALATDPGDKRANVLYADTLTLLFESIARVVEIHQPLVETYYGPGRLVILMDCLQKECDRQARKILDHFKRNRDFERKSQQVQQSLMYQKASTLEKPDPKALDVLLAEITLLHTRAELYLRFVRRRIAADIEISTQDEDLRKVHYIQKGLQSAAIKKTSEKDIVFVQSIEAKSRMKDVVGAAPTGDAPKALLDMEVFISECELSRLMQDLICNYIMMEEYFMREMVVKAVSMDVAEEGLQTSSMVDDAFFIVKKCVRRALSSSSVDGVCAMLNHACGIMEQDFREVLYSRLRQGFPSGFDFASAYNLVQSSFQQGKLQSSDLETQKAKAAFLITLNNAEASRDYIQTLKLNIEEEINKLYGQVNEQSKAKLQSCLADLGAVSGRFKDVLDYGFSQLDASITKPRVKPWVDTFLATGHNISEEDFGNYEANDPWVQTFIFNLDSLLLTFKDSLTNSNYDSLVSHLANEVTMQLEKGVFKMTFNRLGGLQFDKDLRSLVGYLTSATTWTIRDKFARLTQMATILNLEKVSEIMDYWGPNSGPLTWRLTPAEVRQVLGLRVDFRSDDIKRLKL